MLERLYTTMKSEQKYQLLKELAEKLDIHVSENKLNSTGINIRIKSGLCKIKNRKLFILDKNQSVKDKIDLLAHCLSKIPNDNIYIVPAVREILEKKKKEK